MLYRQKKDTFIRNYDNTGYIVSTNTGNDRIVNQSGTVFLCALSREPQTLDELTKKILKSFTEVDEETIKTDAEEFFNVLADDGFIVKGESKEELDANESFPKKNIFFPSEENHDFTSIIKRSNISTQDFLETHFKDNPHLTSFQIELTSRCNERCVHCYIPHEFKLYDITEKLYYNALDQLSAMGTIFITLSGGEPMYHPKFKEFLKKAKSYDFCVNVLSNLTLLDDETIQILKDVRTSSVKVSLYSMIPEHHDAITKVQGSFEKTKNSILKLLENNIPVHVSCPTMKGNKDDFIDVLKWCNEHKISVQTDYIMVAQYNHNTSNLSNRLSTEEVGKIIHSIAEYDKEYQSAILAPNFEEQCNANQFNPDRRICGVGISSCCMVSNGDIYPCPGWQGMVLGNLNVESLQEIWKNSKKIKWLRSLKMKDMGNGECCKCDKAAFCSPCMVRNANESTSDDPLEINRHFCSVAAKNRQLVLDWRNKNLKK